MHNDVINEETNKVRHVEISSYNPIMPTRK